jgi:hypothetical protein
MPQRIYQGCCHYHHLYHEQGDCHGQKIESTGKFGDRQPTHLHHQGVHPADLVGGLGAYAKAQEEGGKIFEALVQEGEALQTRTRQSADEKIAAMTDKTAGT